MKEKIWKNFLRIFKISPLLVLQLPILDNCLNSFSYASRKKHRNDWRLRSCSIIRISKNILKPTKKSRETSFQTKMFGKWWKRKETSCKRLNCLLIWLNLKKNCQTQNMIQPKETNPKSLNRSIFKGTIEVQTKLNRRRSTKAKCI